LTASIADKYKLSYWFFNFCGCWISSNNPKVQSWQTALILIGEAIDAGFVGEDDFCLAVHGFAPLLLIPPLRVEMAAGEGGGGDQQEYEWQ